MPHNWKTYKLSEAFNIIGGGTPKTKVEEYWNGDIPWLSVVDFNNDQRTVTSTEKTITELGLKNSSTKLLKKGQLIISARGTVGQLAQLGRDMTFNQSCYGLTGKDLILINNYGYYLLKHSVSNIQSNAHGSVFDTITRNTFENIEVSLPEIKEQRAIASILSALDDKIELNLQMNKTLEDMAMALYKHYFVDFGPFQNGEFIDSELGPIPKGWEVKRLEDISKIKGGKRLPKGSQLQIEPNDHPYIRVKDFESFYLTIDGMEYVPNHVFDRISNYIVNTNDIVLTIVGTIGKIALIARNLNKASLTENCVKISIYKKELSPELIFTHLISRNGQDEIKSKTVGSTQPKLPIYNIKSLRIALPNELDIIREMTRTLQDYFKIISNSLIENEILTQLRDTLLPKLISGEIRVKDIEKTVSAVL